MKLIAILLLAATTSFALADDGVDITDPSRVSELVALQEKLDAVSTAIMGCMDSGGTHQACLCEHRDLIVRFNTSVKRLFANDPGLEKLDLVRFKSPDGTSIGQSLESNKKQASVDPSCP